MTYDDEAVIEEVAHVRVRAPHERRRAATIRRFDGVAVLFIEGGPVGLSPSSAVWRVPAYALSVEPTPGAVSAEQRIVSDQIVALWHAQCDAARRVTEMTERYRRDQAGVAERTQAALAAVRMPATCGHERTAGGHRCELRPAHRDKYHRALASDGLRTGGISWDDSGRPPARADEAPASEFFTTRAPRCGHVGPYGGRRCRHERRRGHDGDHFCIGPQAEQLHWRDDQGPGWPEDQAK